MSVQMCEFEAVSATAKSQNIKVMAWLTCGTQNLFKILSMLIESVFLFIYYIQCVYIYT